MSFERILSRQECAADKIRKFLSNHGKPDQKNLELELYQTRLKLLEAYWENFEHIHDELISQEAVLDSDEDRTDELPQIEDAYFSAKAQILQQLEALSPDKKKVDSAALDMVKPVPRVTDMSVSVFRLPPIKLFKFSGDYLKWESFREQFKYFVHDAPNMSNVTRFLYLKSLLTGRAARVIDGISFSEENYEIAWKALLREFDDKRTLLTCYFNRVMSLKPVKTATASNLSRIIYTTKGIQASLRGLGRPVEHWDDWFVYLTLQKLDKTTYRDWIFSRMSQEDIPTFEELYQFLVRTIRALDVIESVEGRRGNRK